MSVTIQSNDLSISKHVQEVYLGKYVLPEFQRTFVWDYEKVKSLWESLYDGYPIGQLMFWAEATIDFPVRALGVKQNEIKELKNVEKAIIDGQQRLSAIWLVLIGEIELYFNIETNKFTYDSRAKNLIRLDILNNRSYDDARKKSFFFAHATAIQKENFADTLDELNSMFTGTDIPFQIITNTDYNTVVSIFNRLNQQGVKLTEGQIALATISKHWKGVFKRTFDLMRNLNTKFSYSKNEDPDLIIQTWACIHTGQHLIKNLAPESGRSKYYKHANKEGFENSWFKLEKAFEKTVALMEEKFDLMNYQFIPGYYPMVVLTHFFANHVDKNGNINVEQKEVELLCQWFLQSIITSRYAVRSTTKFREDIKATQVGKKLEELFTHKYEPLNPNTFNINNLDIANASFKSSFVTLLYILMRKNKAVDFYQTDIQVGDKLSNNQSWHFHHIFPDSLFDGKRQLIKDQMLIAEENGTDDDVKKLSEELQKLNETVYSIPNLAFLTPSTNAKINAKDSQEYLQEILQNQNGKEILESQFIPLDPSLWRIDRFKEFCEKRIELILKNVNDYLVNLNLI